jgi:predicted nucleotidyltransferase component of viral defense system
MNKSIEQKVKERLKTIARREGIQFNQILQSLFLERFMVRLSKSRYRENFIFKGGMCLSQYLDLGRETVDLDFLLQKMEANTENVHAIFDEVSKVGVDDGFEFSTMTIGLLSITHKKYPGYRISIIGKLGQIKQKINIDIGVGDVVRPTVLEIELMQDNEALFEESISLNSYPPDYIFAEKLEAIIHLGENNGRMKDFHDCIRIINDNSISKDNFKNAIDETFSNRNTKFSLINFEEDKLKARWVNFHTRNKIKESKLKDLIEVINSFLIGIGFK